MLKLFKGLKPYWTLVIGVLVLVFISTMTDLELPDLMSDIVDTGIVQGDVSYILGRGGVMLLVALLGTVCTILTSYLSSKIGMGFSRDLRKKVFEKVESFSLTEINEVGTASLITRTTNDINQVQMVVIMMMRMMLSAPLMIVGALIMALGKDVELSKVILVVIPIIIVTIAIIAKFTLPMFQKMQNKIDKLNLEVEELDKKKQINEKQTTNDTKFNRCKKSVLDYMSLKNPTKDQVKRLIDRIEIDKDKKVYVHLKFPELVNQI